MSDSLSSTSGLRISPQELPAPTVPNYQLLRRIGRGSYGEVWLARNLMGEFHAVKAVYRAAFGEDEHHFAREIRGIQLYAPISRTDESLVPVLYSGRDDVAGCFYYVMELADAADLEVTEVLQTFESAPLTGSSTVAADKQAGSVAVPSHSGTECPITYELAKGHAGAGDSHAPPETRQLDEKAYVPRTLRTVLKAQGRLPCERCVEICAALATALQQLHKNGLVHRDIKPANIIFVHGRAKLADIGLVTDLEASKSFVGTMGYIPPEGPGQPAADVYALGKLLYEMATGRDRFSFPELPPFAGMTETEQQSLRDLNLIFSKACENDPKRRYKTATEIRNDLLLLRAGESLLGHQERERAFARLRRTMRWSAPVAAAGLAVFGVWFYKDHAAELLLERQGHLREAGVERLGLRRSGWLSRSSDYIRSAAAVHSDNDLIEQSVAAYAGLDVRTFGAFTNIGGSCLAFDHTGRLLVGGLTHGSLHLWDPEDPDHLNPLATEGDGPIVFDLTGELCSLLQLSLARSGCVTLSPERFCAISAIPYRHYGTLMVSRSSPFLQTGPMLRSAGIWVIERGTRQPPNNSAPELTT